MTGVIVRSTLYSQWSKIKIKIEITNSQDKET